VPLDQTVCILPTQQQSTLLAEKETLATQVQLLRVQQLEQLLAQAVRAVAVELVEH
jgi:hypothetical protein